MVLNPTSLNPGCTWSTALIDAEQRDDRELGKFVEGRRQTNVFDLRRSNTATEILVSSTERAWHQGRKTCAKVLSHRNNLGCLDQD